MSQETLSTTSNSSRDEDAIVVAREVTEPPAEQPDISSHFPKPFVCDVCKSSYARLDHLARHFRTHGQQKPFTCPHCSKQFARSDILKRHVDIHLNPKSGLRTGTGNRRTRAARACTLCAESKLRCEGTDPCQRCHDRGLKCQYAQRSRTRKGPGGSISGRTRVCMTESPVASDEGDPATPSAITAEAIEVHALASFADVSDISHPLSKPRVGSYDDSAIKPLTPTSFDTGLLMDDADSFAGFLKDIMYGGINGEVTQPGPEVALNPMPMDFLNFGLLGETSSHTGFGPSRESSWCYPSTAWQKYHHGEPPADTPSHGNLSDGEDAFRQSLWSWTPREGDHWRSQTAELIPCLDDLLSDYIAQSPQTYACIPILASTRHRLVSMMLTVSGEGNYERIMATFPSLATLNYLLSKDLQCRSMELHSWIHVGTFNPNLACPHLVFGLIISGAFRCGDTLFWKLGLSMLELHLELCLRLFSSNHQNARLIAPIQSFVITIEAGLWSGDSRRLELCEAFSNTLVTMARRAGFFQLGPFDGPLPRVDDSSDTLEMKWQMWVDHESRKRFDPITPSSYSFHMLALAYHCYGRLGIHILNVCTQFSLALVMTPLVKYTEMSVPLPAARSLWDASSAEAWRSAYLALENQSLASLPQLRTCYSNFATLLHLGDALDAPSAGLAILSGLWMNVWQYKERVKARNTSTETLHTNTNSALIIQSLQHEARGVLEDFKSVYTQLTGTMEPNLLALHEQQLVHLYISLEDVQYLGGKAGEVEARRVLPLLTRWVKGRASRQAAWHAGQILRVGRQELGPTLRASIIIALYHASLTLWVYSILSDVPSVDMPIATSQRQLHQNRDHCAGREPLALVDGEDTPVVQRFLLVPGAIAAITPSVEDMQPIVLHISHASAVMTAIATLLRDRSDLKAYWDCPSLVDNLTRLVERLGRTAERVYR